MLSKNWHYRYITLDGKKQEGWVRAKNLTEAKLIVRKYPDFSAFAYIGASYIPESESGADARKPEDRNLPPKGTQQNVTNSREEEKIYVPPISINDVNHPESSGWAIFYRVVGWIFIIVGGLLVFFGLNPNDVFGPEQTFKRDMGAIFVGYGLFAHFKVFLTDTFTNIRHYTQVSAESQYRTERI
ncbi:MAG: hypothetical protein CMO74_04545 [Verrucomicrobiales bacterium]|nr:hypothetical protein [Verrucomicrobiales bacterium]|tara:strand:- start:566 stop:1120 length:555 start_codon:yes stop_codon:yes gene_type:complete